MKPPTPARIFWERRLEAIVNAMSERKLQELLTYLERPHWVVDMQFHFRFSSDKGQVSITPRIRAYDEAAFKAAAKKMKLGLHRRKLKRAQQIIDRAQQRNRRLTGR